MVRGAMRVRTGADARRRPASVAAEGALPRASISGRREGISRYNRRGRAARATEKGFGDGGPSSEVGSADSGTSPAEDPVSLPELKKEVEAKAASSSVKFSVTSDLSEDDVRAMQQYAQSTGIQRTILGALVEARLIEWPALGVVASTTLLVMGITAGTAVALLGFNTLLAKMSESLL